MMSARKCAFEAICRVIDGGAYNNVAIGGLYEKYSLSPEDKNLCGIIVKGVLERKITLDYLVSKLSAFPIEEIDKKVLNLLRMGLYQILYLDRVPDFAICNESVEIAEAFLKYGKNEKKKKGFVNGVLRNACRRKKELVKLVSEAPKYVRYSMTEELFALISEQYGNKAEEIAESYFEKGGNALRVNPLKTTSVALCQKLSALGMECEIISERTIMVKDNFNKALPLIESGEFYVQGLSSQRAVEVLGAKAGDTVVDVCACPGGKTVGAAMDMENKGEIYAFDIHENKLPLILKNADSLGITIIKTEKHNSRKINEKYINKASKVICDVPCSGIGSIGKRPEIRYKSLDDINGLLATQKDILSSSLSYLKTGGTLVYSVCSINKNEGEYLIRDFIKENPEKNKSFRIVFEETVLPSKGCDGFYICKIEKIY
jgi:16S rRNA (cytosine967-C5)-methyltransferase